jgi:anti-anti-sigma factor
MTTTRRLLTLTLRPDRDRVYIVPEGEIDMANSGELRNEVEELRRNGFDDIAVDLRQTAFIDSTMLSLVLELTDLARAEGWTFGVVPGPPPVQRVFEITGTLDRINFIWPKR